MCNLINEMIIAFTLVGYEMIITNSMAHASLASSSDSYHSCVHGIIVNYLLAS